VDGIERLRRWEDAGGTWRVLHGRATPAAGDDTGDGAGDGAGPLVSLCRCDGGEEVERVRLAGPEAAAYVRARPSSEDPEPV
jgi:hypothetical protein